MKPLWKNINISADVTIHACLWVHCTTTECQNCASNLRMYATLQETSSVALSHIMTFGFGLCM